MFEVKCFSEGDICSGKHINDLFTDEEVNSLYFWSDFESTVNDKFLARIKDINTCIERLANERSSLIRFLHGIGECDIETVAYVLKCGR